MTSNMLLSLSTRFPQMVFVTNPSEGLVELKNLAVFRRALLTELSVYLIPQQAFPHPVAYQGPVFVRYVKANVGSLFV